MYYLKDMHQEVSTIASLKHKHLGLKNVEIQRTIPAPATFTQSTEVEIRFHEFLPSVVRNFTL
jgi:hypothetical protein